MLDKERIRRIIARRVAAEFQNGDTVTLGIGLPTEVSNYIPAGVHVMTQGENGILGIGPVPDEGRADERVTNAGGALVTINSGGCYFDSVTAFGMIRGGHVSAVVLGALQVDAAGNLANWIVPGKRVPGMGGAMDLVVGARRVIIAMEHTAKGEAKILKKCTLPLTAAGEVDLIVTEKCVMRVQPGGGLILTELSPLVSLEELHAVTEADFTVSPRLKTMNVD